MPIVDFCEYDIEHSDYGIKTGNISANFSGIFVCRTRWISTGMDVVTT
jgi:hypothetical protein